MHEYEEEKPTSGEPPGSQLKVVGRLADQCQDALVQLGTFLASSHAPDEYAARLPPLQELLRDYHVDADVAFFLHRPVLTQKIAARAEFLRKGIDAKTDNLDKSIERYMLASKETLEPILTSVTPMLPARVWEDISPEFYVTFWSLSMYDLRVPVESYEREIERLKTAAANAAKDTSQGTKGKKEQERFNTLIEKLQPALWPNEINRALPNALNRATENQTILLQRHEDPGPPFSAVTSSCECRKARYAIGSQIYDGRPCIEKNSAKR
ncbi:hypothetical protein evm_000901 [Chilo suppressalis]|nr:hypothetical protein evm_000901 [Chilo suppressalis]